MTRRECCIYLHLFICTLLCVSFPQRAEGQPVQRWLRESVVLVVVFIVCIYLFPRCYLSDFRRELKDNLGSDDPEGDVPVLLQMVLSRNPTIFREKSTPAAAATAATAATGRYAGGQSQGGKVDACRHCLLTFTQSSSSSSTGGAQRLWIGGLWVACVGFCRWPFGVIGQGWNFD